MKTNETYLTLRRPSAGPFFKSILAEIYFTIYTWIIKWYFVVCFRLDIELLRDGQ